MIKESPLCSSPRSELLAAQTPAIWHRALEKNTQRWALKRKNNKRVNTPCHRLEACCAALIVGTVLCSQSVTAAATWLSCPNQKWSTPSHTLNSLLLDPSCSNLACMAS